MTQDEALKVVDDIENAIKNGAGGMKDDRTVRTIQGLCNRIRVAIPESSFKTVELMSHVEIYFSPRKHQKYGGPDRVRQFAYNMVAGLRMIVNHHFLSKVQNDV